MSDEASGRVYKLEASTGIYSSSGFDVNTQVITYPQKLLAIAQSLIDSGEFSISVVVAHMACEVATDRAFTDAFKAKGIEYLEEAFDKLLPGNNLGNDKTREFYTALTGDDIGQIQPFWQRFKESATRRNKISHNGATVGQAEAEASLAVAKEFVAHLKK
jgi:hypothetical protein